MLQNISGYCEMNENLIVLGQIVHFESICILTSSDRHG